MKKPSALLFVAAAWLPIFIAFMVFFPSAPRTAQWISLTLFGLLPFLLLIITLQDSIPSRRFLLTSSITLVTGGLAVATVTFPALSPPTLEQPKKGESNPLTLGGFTATHRDVADVMFEMAEVTDHDVVYDLGCGDGRVVVAAAKQFGARGVGIDLDEERVREALENVKQAGVDQLVEIRHGDALKVEDLDQATVVVLYVTGGAMLRLRPILQEKLKTGCRIVSHDAPMDDWIPDEVRYVWSGDDRSHLVYLWNVKAHDEGQ